MNPYFTDGTITLYHGDCLEVATELPPASAAAVITDPPYVFGPASARNARSWWSDMMNAGWWYGAWYREAARLIPDSGSFWTFHNWRTTPIVHKAAHDAGLHLSAQVCWDKIMLNTGGPRGLRHRYELISLMPGPDFRIADRGLPDVWAEMSNARKAHGHPAEKPPAIIRRVIEACQLQPGDTVVDLFAGSGTTLAVAQELGLSAIGIEADERWCEVIATRLAAAKVA